MRTITTSVFMFSNHILAILECMCHLSGGLVVCVRACVRECVRVCVRVCVYLYVNV